MKTLITAEQLTVFRKEQTVLKDISLTINNHDFITIIGPNGAGKSVLLKCLLGLCKIDKGDIMRRKGLRIGYVPQNLATDHAIPISTRRFLSLNKKTDLPAISRVIEEVNIQNILHKPLYVLSGGELQRVLLARALLDEPELLVLDEPAQNLDVSSQLACYQLLEKIYGERQLSILMVSHDLHLVMSCTKHVICLFHHICCSGEPQAVTKDPEFIALFGNVMARSVSVYHHSHDHQHNVIKNA